MAVLSISMELRFGFWPCFFAKSAIILFFFPLCYTSMMKWCFDIGKLCPFCTIHRVSILPKHFKLSFHQSTKYFSNAPEDSHCALWQTSASQLCFNSSQSTKLSPLRENLLNCGLNNVLLLQDDLVHLSSLMKINYSIFRVVLLWAMVFINRYLS